MKMSWASGLLSAVFFAAVTVTSVGHADELGTEPFTFQEGLNAVGYPGRFGVATGGLKVAIVDAGFHGIDEWLTQNGDRAESVFKRTEIKYEESHGFKVFQVANAVLPDAKFYLYEVDLTSRKLFTEQMSLYVQDMAARGIDFVNVSLGFFVSPYSEQRAGTWEVMELFRKHQVFAIFTSGNERENTHSWTVSAVDKGFIKLIGADSTESFSATVSPSSRASEVRVYWEPKPDDPPVTVTLQQKVDGNYKTFMKGATNGETQLTYLPDQDKPKATGTIPGQIVLYAKERPLKDEPYILAINVGDGVEKFIGRRMSLHIRGPRFQIAGGKNGSDSYQSHAQFEDPFVLFVGAFAKTMNGKVAPADYSSFGVTPAGVVIPHVLGPGNFTFPNGEVDVGTSYAAPFITAVLSGASMRHFNPKNVAERISSHAFLTANPTGPDRGRYGVPDGGVLLNPAKLQQLLSPNRIDKIAHRVDGEELVFRGEISRCCMEGVDAQVLAIVAQVDDSGGQPKLTAINGAVGATTFTTGAKDYDALPVEVRVPLSAMPTEPGKLLVQFAIRKTKSGSHPFLLPGPKPYIFTLP